MTRRVALGLAAWCALSVLAVLPLLVGAVPRKVPRHDHH